MRRKSIVLILVVLMMITGCSFSVIDEKSTENAAGSSAENA